MMVTRKQGAPNFPKNEHFLPPDTQIITTVLRFALLLYYRQLYQKGYYRAVLTRD